MAFFQIVLLPVFLAVLCLPFVTSQGLNARFQATGRYYGTFSDARYLNDQAYIRVLGNTSEIGSITPGNSQKWDSIEPSRGSFQFGTADQIVNFARQHNQTIRGHTLVWHSQLAGWVNSVNNANDMRTVITNHVTKVMDHYKNSNVIHWDVVNEVFESNGQFRNSVFYRTMGKEFISHAFKAARAADPKAKLYLNEYDNDFGAKADAFYNLAKELAAAGLIDGVGMQSHWILGQVPSAFVSNLKRLAALNVDVAITELDVRMQTPSNQQKLQQQATDYTTVTKACLAEPRCIGITVASFTDKYSWVPNTFPGYGEAHPMNSNLQPKPAYNAIVSAINAAF